MILVWNFGGGIYLVGTSGVSTYVETFYMILVCNFGGGIYRSCQHIRHLHIHRNLLYDTCMQYWWKTIQERLAAHDLEKARSIAAGNRENAKLMEERQRAAKESSAVRTLFPDTMGKVTLTEGEPSSPAQSTMGPV